MACEASQDDQIGEVLLIGVVKQEVMNMAVEGNAAPLSLPEAQPISNRQDQKLVEQLAETIRVIGDRLDQDTGFNDMIDGLVKVADKSSFWNLVEKVFRDDQINWGRIIVLFYSVGKLAAKMVLARLPSIVLEILNLSLDFFRRHLLKWIRQMGGWITSIPGLARFTIERFSSSSWSTYSSFFRAMLTFTGGVLLGGLFVWRFKKSS
ncbi:BCL2 associated X, apoptosis regulator b [Myxocyprinus asiaticus]|uniref:BCL2 associated X, apoptosis regulator b n=1 Tax=Myxocyprinus asiaticus TaxID=70543 RepID=UPI0022220B9C|nr:BCL2 associated X, apoptosis regulator b [Myxocyprinus asiaticus]